MTWNLNLGGHAETQQDEASIIDKIESFIESLGVDTWHSLTTSFHGTGDIATLRQNVQPREDASVDPATGQTVTDATATDAAGDTTVNDPAAGQDAAPGQAAVSQPGTETGPTATGTTDLGAGPV